MLCPLQLGSQIRLLSVFWMLLLSRGQLHLLPVATVGMMMVGAMMAVLMVGVT